MWQEPKTDWTAADVYNISEALTRVEGNLHEVAVQLQGIGVSAALDEKLQWTTADFPTARELSRIGGNIRALKAELALPAGLPPVPTFADRQVFTYHDANALEAYTAALYAVARGTVTAMIPCGVMACGARPLLPV